MFKAKKSAYEDMNAFNNKIINNSDKSKSVMTAHQDIFISPFGAFLNPLLKKRA